MTKQTTGVAGVVCGVILTPAAGVACGAVAGATVMGIWTYAEGGNVLNGIIIGAGIGAVGGGIGALLVVGAQAIAGQTVAWGLSESVAAGSALSVVKPINDGFDYDGFLHANGLAEAPEVPREQGPPPVTAPPKPKPQPRTRMLCKITRWCVV